MISDLHVGSRLAVWPREDIITHEGNNLTLMINRGQRKLQEYWYDELLPVCEKFNVDTILNGADACDGVNKKESGAPTITRDLEYQKDAAEALLTPLVKDRKYHSVSGTVYHESLDTKVHRDISKRLKAVAKTSKFHGALGVWRLKGTNKIMNFAHAATSALIYPSTVLDRERIFLRAAEGTGQINYHTDYFIRGHLHFYFHLDYPDMHIIQLPCWKAWHPIGDKIRLFGRTQPNIGAVLLLVDKQNRTFVLHFIYKTPKIIDFIRSI